MTEFELIARYFDRPGGLGSPRVGLGIGDDCALLAPAAGSDLAVSTDMLVAGRHFFHDADPSSIGWKTLAVNLSDLAAMGARPLAFTLALALPEIDESWVDAFARGLFECADAFDCELVGGDTTRGPLNLCVTVFGEVGRGRAMRRADARVGDDVWVSGEIGTAALALDASRGLRAGDVPSMVDDPSLRRALDRPVPRVALGQALSGVAHAAIDVSDGLAQDLGHVLAASRCAATLRIDAIPLHPRLASCDPTLRHRLALTGGDDYELCFTAASSDRAAVAQAGERSATRVTRIGAIVDGSGLRLVDGDGGPDRSIDLASLRGFDHFA